MEKLQMLKPPNYAHKIVHYFTTCPDFNEIIRTDGRITIQTWDMYMYLASCKANELIRFWDGGAHGGRTFVSTGLTVLFCFISVKCSSTCIFFNVSHH